MKTFTIVSNDAPKKVFETEATTVGELKAALTANGIDYADKAIFEGLTRLEFTNAKDDVVLPHDVNYKGTTTDNLVFMLTAAKKKISSGASRAEIMAEIRDRGLTEEVKRRCGRNYTQVPTVDLVAVINMSVPASPVVETPAVVEEDPEIEAMKKILSGAISLTKILNLEDLLIEEMENAGLIELASSEEKVIKPIYSEEEISEMFE